jgi:hypothetical protein
MRHNIDVNGLGVGTTVSLGVLLGFALFAPADFPRAEMAVTILFWGFITGLIFEAYRFAFTWKHPFRP